MNNQYFEMFADDKTNQMRSAQFDALIEECTPELRARLLTAVDTLKASGQNIGELVAKVTVFQLCRYLSMPDKQRQDYRNIGIQHNMMTAPEHICHARSNGQVYKFLGEEL
jgi:hypothetical protein